MPLQLACPACGKSYAVADAMSGRKVKCAGCGQVFVAQQVMASATSGPAEPPARPPAPAPNLPPLLDELGDLSQALASASASPVASLPASASPLGRPAVLSRPALSTGRSFNPDELLQHPAVFWAGGLLLGLVMGLLACGAVTIFASGKYMPQVERARKLDGKVQLGPAVWSVVIDMLPINEFYLSARNKDLATGRNIGLTMDQRGAAAGTAAAKVCALVIGPIAGVVSLHIRRRRLANQRR